MEASHPYLTIRTTAWLFLGVDRALAVQQGYTAFDYFFVFCCYFTLLLEFAVVVVFGLEVYTTPTPPEIITLWKGLIVAIPCVIVYHYQLFSKPKKTKEEKNL